MIKRYEPVSARYGGCDMCGASMEECADGEYVEIAQVVDAIKRCIEDETKDDIVSSLCEEFGIDL